MLAFIFFWHINTLACEEQVLPQLIGASPSGKASAFGADIRWFESSRPSQSSKVVRNGDFFFYFQALKLARR